ncbi:AfsR/SARP family transcriptional regulator [Streptomyces rubiginosohelvolus]|uniref:BTAD domain-containing putative transcriptional regulator n=1 Tax=Streptomyces rubiginosohelvolus TaxID=67362 RepID=A0ABW6F512_9ACTN
MEFHPVNARPPSVTDNGPVHYCVLGTTRALRDDGTAVTLGGARLRALLTVLALRPGRTVPAGVLVDEVWDGDPPADAAGALQALIGRLRRALGHSAVESVAGGYRLAAPPDAVDLHRFERLAGEGNRALENGDAADALAVLGEALALWSGPALADLPDSTAAASRWEARRLDARRAALGALLALGRPGEALPELAVLCDAHPLDEPLQVLRIRALRDAGRPAEALAAYEEVRTLLDDRLGTAPGPALRALHAELLHPEPFPQPSGAPAPGSYARGAGEPATRSAPDHAGGAAPKPGPRTGARLSAPDGAEEPTPHSQPTPGPGGPAASGGQAAPEDPASTDGPAAFGGPAPAHSRPDVGGPAVLGDPASPGGRPALGSPAPAAYPPAPGNLRARLTSFVGRDTDMAALREDLGRARLVTLLGPGGAGKTRLSQETAEAAAHAWPDGVWLAELAPVDDPDTVPEAVLTALGARETVLRGAGAEELRATDRTAADPLVRLTEHCAPRSMLLLLDNCEHVIGGAAALADQLLSHCPRLTILATSREPLGVPGEFVRPVDPLPDPMALRLLAERGAAARPGFRTDADEATAAACAEICRRLDGLPLAIELAAARLRMLTPRQIADRLDDRFRLLTNGSRTVLPRQQTLRAVVDWSWDLLDDTERAVLRRLSVFAGGCSLAAAEEVCALPAGPGGPAVDSLDVAALLGSLVDKSLVVAAPGDDGEMRYRLLETVGEYAAERLAEAGEREAVERRHLVHFRELARITGPRVRGSGQREAIAVLQREYENLRTALRHAVTARDEHEALCIVLSMAWYWMLRDLRSDAGQWSASVAALGPDPFAAPGVRAPALLEHPIDRPPPMDDDQLAEARRGAALLQLAGVDDAISTWSSPEGKERLRIIADTYRPGMPQTCRLPGTLWLFANMIAGDEDRLNTVLDETVRASRVHGGEWELGSALHTRANIRSNSPERVADARADADESLEIYTRLGDDWGAAEALAARGEANERAGRFLAALDDYREAVEYARKIGAQSQAALLRARYAGSLIELERLQEAEAILRDVIENGRHLSHEALPMARMHLAFVLGLQGQVDEARQQTHLVREDFKDRDVAIFGGFVHGVLAWLDNLDGDHVSALSNALTALESAREPLSMMVAPQMPSAYVTAMAQAIAGFEGADAARDAVRLLGFQERLLPEGHVPTVMERRNWALTEQAARDRLGDGAVYTAAYEQGGGLTFDEATALAETYRRAHSSA